MSNPLDHVSEAVKHVIDAISIAAVIGTLSNMLPSIAALLSAIWSLIRIYETKTVQSWLKKKDDDEDDDAE